MITDAILTFFFGLIDLAFGLLPTNSAVLPNSPDLSLLAAANMILPIDYVLYLIGIAIPIMLAGLAFWGVMKVVNLLRGAGA